VNPTSPQAPQDPADPQDPQDANDPKEESMSRPTLSSEALLPTAAAQALANDPEFGAGNLLSSAIAVNPRPDAAFVHSVRPLLNAAGEPQHDFSLLQLDALAQSWSAWYWEQGVRPRDRVAVQLDDSFAYSLHFFALSQLGAIPVLVNSNMPGPTALRLMARTAPVGLFTDRTHLERLGPEASALPGLRWTQLAEDMPVLGAQRLPDHARFRHAAEDPVSILHSSGTTGDPKPIIQTHLQSVAGPRWRLLNFVEEPDSLMLAAQPQSHVGAISYTMYALAAGSPLVALYDPSGADMLSALRTYRPTAVLAFAHAYGELAALELAPEAIGSVLRWITMGDAIHEAHIQDILKAVEAGRAEGSPSAGFYDRFGSTELGWGLFHRHKTASAQRIGRSIGTPDSLATAAVLRENGTHADVGEIGWLGVRSPTVTKGYWNDSDTTYRSELAGYWLPGDLAYQDSEGAFFQVDRAVDVIRTASGPGYSVLMEELLLMEVPEIQDVTVVAGRYTESDETSVPVVVAVPEGQAGEPAKLLTRINEVLAEAGHPEAALVEVALEEGDFPLGATGKVLKRQLREKYADLTGYLRLADGSGKALAATRSASTHSGSTHGGSTHGGGGGHDEQR
jgi:acyl-coenzyme A synthetase/AMP-(fatty) acid ligase